MLSRTIVTLAAKRGSILGLCLSGFTAFAENDGIGCLPCTFVNQPNYRQPRPLTIVTLAAKRGSILGLCLSGFPAFAENDGRTGVLTRTFVNQPHHRQPRPLTIVTLAAKQESILGFHSWFSRLQPLMIGQRSCHSGLDFTIKSSFQVRFHFFIAFSRMIADSMDECCSNHTSK